MMFLKNSNFIEHNKIIGISVGKSSPDQLHNKILINFDDFQGELHLQFHHNLIFSDSFDSPNMYIWGFPSGIPESRLKALVARCIKVINNIDKQDIPYAIEYKGKRKFDKEGVYSSYTSGDEYGVTCATFILTLFESVGLEILDWKNWESRDEEDKVWFLKLIRLIEIQKAKGNLEITDEHLANLKSEENCQKIRPEEIYSIVHCSNHPMKFMCSSSIGEIVRKHLISL